MLATPQNHQAEMAGQSMGQTSPFVPRPLMGLPANFPLCMAPMVGLTHVAFRELCRSYLPANTQTIWPSEMLSTWRLPHEDLSATPETMRAPNETFWVPQILGNDEKAIAASLVRLSEWGADGYDINMGCPVQKALKHNYGVALMGDSQYAADVVKMTVRHAQGRPVSVKLRGSEQQDQHFLVDFMQGLEASGASWLTLHPRTPEQKRRGRANWTQIALARASLKIPVIGNGDIQISQDVWQLIESTGAQMAMAGRALTARPWLFWQIAEDLGLPAPQGRTGSAPRTPEEEGAEYLRAAQKMLGLCYQFFAPEIALKKFRFYLKTGAPWLHFGHHLYALSTQAKTQEQMQNHLNEFFAGPQLMSERTELRQ